jgi:hypothetical protein
MDIINPSFIDLLLEENLEGGNPETILEKISNIKNKYLKQKTFSTNKLVFQFLNDYNKKKLDNSKYLGKGANTVVCAIKQIKPIETDKIYIIRIFQDTVSSTKKLIDNNYKIDKLNFKTAIPNIYCYGKILDIYGNDININGSTQICYVITDLYKTDFNNLRFCNKIKVFVNLLKLLNEAYHKKLFFWDLKLDNIGYDDKFNCIMVDYDAKCILKFPVNNPIWYGGTYYAVYITGLMALSYQHGNNTQQIKWESDKKVLPEKFHDKLGICGLPDIILGMFFNGTNRFHFIKQENNYGSIYHSAYNFYDYHELRKNIKIYSRKYEKEKYNDFYNDIYDLLIDDDANGVLSLYYDKVPSYEKMIEIFEKYDKSKTIEGGYKKYILYK